VADAPGKFAAVNSSLAGSLASTPKLICGTIVWFVTHTWPSKYEPPKLRLWVPRCQFTVSSRFQLQALRWLGV
jgi:hypothetical protein